MQILLIRHGKSTGNGAGRMAGHSDDGLSLQGVLQSIQLGRWLHRQSWSPSHIYTSPLRRARETLQQLAEPWAWRLEPGNQGSGEESGVRGQGAREPGSQGRDGVEGALGEVFGPDDPPTVTVADHLAEFQAGILTGLTWAEAEAHYPQLCAALMASPDWVPIPDAETPAQGRDRAQQFIQQLLNQHQQDNAIWVISHQWILQHLIASLLGCDRTWQIPIPNTGLFEFEIDRDRWDQSDMARWTSDLWQIKRFGDRPHLED